MTVLKDVYKVLDFLEDYMRKNGVYRKAAKSLTDARS